MKQQLNRIARNYPAIPIIPDNSDAFDIDTEEAVKAFQRIFNLAVDGVVGKATWYKIKQIYSGVKGLSELVSEGITISEAQREYPEQLQLGDSGIGVTTIQYYLAFIGYFFDELPQIRITGTFDENTRDAVYAFQNRYGLQVTGIVERDTWNELTRVYNTLLNDLPENYRQFALQIYPGRFIVPGDSGDSVTVIQQNLQNISRVDSRVPFVNITGNYDEQTQNAVKAVQAILGFEQNGVVGPIVWSYIITNGNNL